MNKSLTIPAFAIVMFLAMSFVDTMCANTLPPVCDTSETAAWLMETLLLFCSLL
jgi:hypothetical protein